MQVGSYNSGFETARAMMNSAGDKMMTAASEASHEDYLDSAVDMMTARNTNKAGVVLARTQDEMMKSTLDMLA